MSKDIEKLENTSIANPTFAFMNTVPELGWEPVAGAECEIATLCIFVTACVCGPDTCNDATNCGQNSVEVPTSDTLMREKLLAKALRAALQD